MSAGDRCLLSPTPVCSRFLAPELNAFVGRLFAAVATASALQPGLPQVSRLCQGIKHHITSLGRMRLAWVKLLLDLCDMALPLQRAVLPVSAKDD